MPESSAPRVAVVQDGARLHYALPVAVQRAGMLEAMYTDYYAGARGAGNTLARLAGKLRPAVAARMAGRTHPEIPLEKVRAYGWLTVRMAAKRKRFDSDEAFFDWQSQRARTWMYLHGLNRAAMDVVVGFVRNIDPALCESSGESGMLVVADQMIAPRAIEQREENIQRVRWPDWEEGKAQGAAELTMKRERRTWNAATHITCASDYVRDGLLREGVPKEKITVFPYPIDATHYRVPNRARRGTKGEPLVVGFVGSVNLRKGTPYFFNVAKRFDPSYVRFVMVGPVHLREAVAAEQRGAVELVGGVPRSEVAQWLEKFDLFFFPSTCEGSAGAVMEALAVGLPVITSPESGSVVQDGVEGFIRRYDDVEGYTEAIDTLARDGEWRAEMSRAARAAAEVFNLDNYSAALGNLLRELWAAAKAGK